MKYSKRFLLAAERIDCGEEEFTCLAVSRTYPEYDNFNYPSAAVYYFSLFAEKDHKLQGLINDCVRVDRRGVRVLLLCLAAAIAKSEGK